MPDGEIIVIGGGYGGIRLAKQLDEVARVTLVDRKEVFFHRIAALRAGVHEAWTTTPFIPYDRLLRNGRVVTGKAVGIDTGERQVTLATGERLPYDVVVIATGADYPEPARFLGTTTEEAGKTFTAHQESVAAAEHVLIVGGGPGGVELAAEIRLARPDARVTLAHAGSELLSSTGSKWAGRRPWRGWRRATWRCVSTRSSHPGPTSAPTGTGGATSSRPTCRSGPTEPRRTRSGCGWPARGLAQPGGAGQGGPDAPRRGAPGRVRGR